MTQKDEYKIEFYHLGHGTEFTHVFRSKSEYEDAKKFLDHLLGSRDVAPQHRRMQGRATVDFYGVDDEQYRAFGGFIRGRQK